MHEKIIKNGKACGVKTSLGHLIESDAVVITSGTFLNGIYLRLLNQVPYFRCCCYDSSYQGPNKLFIRNAFNLP